MEIQPPSGEQSPTIRCVSISREDLTDFLRLSELIPDDALIEYLTLDKFEQSLKAIVSSGNWTTRQAFCI